MKLIWIGKEEIKLMIVFSDDILIYSENSKEALHKKLKLREISKINIKSSIIFLYNISEHLN